MQHRKAEYLFCNEKEIALVSQEIILFDDTIKNNLLFGNPLATDDEIKSACEKANCDKFIEEMNDGYNTLVGENGIKLSGGQKQRVSIARAIAGSPKLILADEPTGALDSKTGLEIMKILNDLNAKGITIVLVTHEDDIANYGSRIIKMKDGKILEDKKNVNN